MKQILSFLKRTLWVLALMCVSTSVVAQEMIQLDDSFVKTKSSNTLKAPMLTDNPAPSLLGDVNGDTFINVADVTMLIRGILNSENLNSGDVDQNGTVNVADVTALIRWVLNSNGFEQDKLQNYLDDVYRSMRTYGWATTGNFHETFGILAQTLMAEVMGDDMIMGAQGSGWFWYEANYNVKQRYTSTSWTSHYLWNSYYTWIGNANYLLAATQSLNGTGMNYIKGQAYAIRAYSYFMLAQWFARTYAGHQNDLCVPFYDGYDFNGSTGGMRSTVAEVYEQIDNDIDMAVTLLNGTTQQKPEHIGYAVALGLRARIALVEEDWNMAYNSAVNAISASGKTVQNVADFRGLNDATAGNVIWGAQIPTEEDGQYASFWAHLDMSKPYAQQSPKQITKWLYNKMSATDTRRAWWTTNPTGVGGDALVQNKFKVVEGSEWDGDYIYMRVEEMFLPAAEAACRLGRTSNAKTNLNAVMTKRVSGYTCNKTGTSLGTLTTDETGSLLEEILIQRRIELWGEDGRIMTIRRLRQGFARNEEDGWNNQLTISSRAEALADPESYAWVMTIPGSEFYNWNSVMIESADQNPIGDYPSGTVDVERNPQHISFTDESLSYVISPEESLTITINMTRPSATSKPYYALIKYGENYTYAYFAPNSRQGSAKITYRSSNPVQVNWPVSLTSIEQEAATSSQRTSMTISITVRNKNPEGQHISFEKASQEFITENADMYNIPIVLTRAVSTEAYAAKLFLTDYDGEQYTIWVNFAPGEQTATVNRHIYDMEMNHSYTLVLQLSDEDIATANPALGQPITRTTVTVTRRNTWEDLGMGVYSSPEFWAEDINVPIQQNIATPNKYRLKNLFENGVDIIFTIEPDGKVYLEEQYCFYYGSAGNVYLRGAYDDSGTGYAGNYNASTRTASLRINYYVPGVGQFGTFDETLTMP